MITCQQKIKCDEPAAFRFTWPGKDAGFICAKHGTELVNIASVMGLHLQLIPLSQRDHAAMDALTEEKPVESERDE